MRGKTWHARLTITVDGESVRRWFDLGTADKPAARRKLARLLKEHAANPTAPIAELAETAKRAESFADACERFHSARTADGVRSAKDEIARLRSYAVPDLGSLEVTAIGTGQINAALDGAKAAGKSRQTVQHLRQDLANVFAALKREGTITTNPVDDSVLPKFPTDRKARAVLTDDDRSVSRMVAPR
jgi:hypothetical protein